MHVCETEKDRGTIGMSFLRCLRETPRRESWQERNRIDWAV